MTNRLVVFVARAGVKYWSLIAGQHVTGTIIFLLDSYSDPWAPLGHPTPHRPTSPSSKILTQVSYRSLKAEF